MPGRYRIRVAVNPGVAAKAHGICPARDTAGGCYMFAESNCGKPAQEEIHPGETKPGSDRNGP